MKRILLAAALFTSLPAGAQHIITTIAGNNITQYIGDGSPATNYSLAQPRGMCLTTGNRLLVADYADMRIRMLSNDTLYTIAGGATTGYCGDGGVATAAGFGNPNGICTDKDGNIYISEWYSSTVRKIDAVTGIISTVAGSGVAGFSGDGGPATAARLGNPGGVAVDTSGNLFIADYYNHRIRMVNKATGLIATIAGTGTNGYSGDNGPASAAKLSFPNVPTLDPSGNIYFTEAGNHTVRRMDRVTGNITTIAGSGTSGYTGDGGPATASKLNQPTGINYGYGGNIIVADFGNNVVRVIDWAGNILTVAGSGGFGFAGDGGPATAATFRRPYAVCSDGLGNVYIADEGNSTIRKVAQPLTLSVPAQAPTQQSLRAYPNPSNGHLTLQLPHGWQNVYITITDCAGRTISSQHTNPSPETIPMDLPDGLYLLSVVNETGAREYARIVVTGSLNH